MLPCSPDLDQIKAMFTVQVCAKLANPPRREELSVALYQGSSYTCLTATYIVANLCALCSKIFAFGSKVAAHITDMLTYRNAHRCFLTVNHSVSLYPHCFMHPVHQLPPWSEIFYKIANAYILKCDDK